MADTLPSELDAIELDAAHAGMTKIPRESGVLVVEDDPDTQWRLARMLTVHGARVVGTSSGEAALALIDQWPADLVLVDQGLPGISGLEVARRIRQQHPDIPVVLMSTEESTDLRLAAKIAGAALMLIKPFRVEVLFEMLQRVKDAGAKFVDVASFDPELASAE
jgi:CheY-like chemotaxis protein